MTREECLLKLLAVEPERHDRIRRITGWSPAETDRTLRHLEDEGRITSHPTICGSRDYRVYFVAPST